MIITEEEFKRQFGPNARLVGQSQNGQVATDYHDVQQEGHVDEDGYFHPIGSQTIQERNKWQSLKKGLPQIQGYINAGVPEQVLRSTIERLTKECAVYGEPGHVTTRKVMDKLAEIFSRNAKFYEEKATIEKEIAEKPKLTPEEEERLINEMADSMKKPGLLSRFLGKDATIERVDSAISFNGKEPYQISHDIDFEKQGEIQKRKGIQLGIQPGSMIPSSMIRLSGGVYFNQLDLDSCFDGKLKLKSHKRAIKLNRKQIKELESQL